MTKISSETKTVFESKGYVSGSKISASVVDYGPGGGVKITLTTLPVLVPREIDILIELLQEVKGFVSP